ncbi:oligosaccharide flippase family protein [Paenibacillus silvae]|uniref:oligosaccharide flippase family protein n=1 Tax=Paenibacillus silvae TaxID=1325358 RepID=UPI003CF0F702
MNKSPTFRKRIRERSSDILNNRNIRYFLGNLGIVFIFRMLSAVLNVVGLVMAARKLGVVALGDISMIQSIAYFLIIPMVFGIHISIIKYLPESDKEQERQIIGSAVICNGVLAGLFVVVFLKLSEAFSIIAHISETQWVLSIALAVVINFATISESILRAKNKFFLLSIGKLIGTSVFFVIVLASYFRSDSFNFFILALIVNFIIFTLIAWIFSRDFKLSFSLKTAKHLYRYGGITMVSVSFSTILFSSDLFIVNYFCSSYDVGMYSVYQVNVRNFFNLLFHEVFAIVFLPAIALLEKSKVYTRILSILTWLLPLAIVGNALLCITLILLYGKDYPLNWLYVAIVSISTGFHFIYWIFHSVFSVEGKRGALLCLITLGIPLPVLILISVLLTKFYGILGTMLATLVIQLVLIGTFTFVIKTQYLNRKIKSVAVVES